MTFENGYMVDGDFFATIKIVHLLEKSNLTQSRTIQFGQSDMRIERSPFLLDIYFLQHQINLLFEA
jgi:hypothetical protein